jgi:hypothetical protein
MADQYFNLLALRLEQHGGHKEYTISKARFDAVQELERHPKQKRFRLTVQPNGFQDLISVRLTENYCCE